MNISEQVTTSIQLIGPMPLTLPLKKIVAIAVDGGANHNFEQTILTVGDGDSGPKMDIPLDPEKDFSDFSYALQLIPSKVNSVYCAGFLGGRRDHELAIWGDALEWLDSQKATGMNFEQEVFALSQGDWEIITGGEFSLFSVKPNKLSLEGSKYSCQELRPWSSHGISNAGDKVHLKNSAPVLVIFPTTNGNAHRSFQAAH